MTETSNGSAIYQSMQNPFYRCNNL